jgi:hypothetical protein
MSASAFPSVTFLSPTPSPVTRLADFHLLTLGETRDKNVWTKLRPGGMERRWKREKFIANIKLSTLACWKGQKGSCWPTDLTIILAVNAKMDVSSHSPAETIWKEQKRPKLRLLFYLQLFYYQLVFPSFLVFRFKYKLVFSFTLLLSSSELINDFDVYESASDIFSFSILM